MKKRFLLITLIMCILGGINLKTLNAQDVVTIDGGGVNSSQYGEKGGPFETYQTETSSYQGIYLKEELGINAGSVITNVAFRIDVSENTSRNIIVWLTNISDDNFGKNIKSALIQMSDTYKVYEGPYDISKTGWIGIDISEKNFEYTGDNLLVTVYDKTGAIGTGNVQFNMFESKKTDDAGNFWFRNLFKKSANPATETKLNGMNNTPSLQLTYTSGSSTPTPPTVTLNTPENDATGIFNPSLSFTLGNAKQYQIQMAEGTGAFDIVQDWTEGNGTISYQTNLLKSNTTYSWKVVAENDYGETTSEVYTFTTRNITAAPGAISGITPANGAEVDSDPQLSWTFGENTESYKVCLSVEDGDWEIVRDWTNTNNALTASFNTASLNDGDGLDANQTYNWQILTKNSFGENGGDVYSFTKVGAPGDVTPISPADGATEVSNTATLSWRFAPHTEEYRVLMDLGEGFEYVTTWIETGGAETAEYTPEGIGGGKTVRWCVEVRNVYASLEVYDTTDEENNPAVFTYTTSNFLAVKNISPVNDSRLDGETATLEWYFQGDATHYQVKLGTDQGEMEVVLDWTKRDEVGTGLVTEGSFTTVELDHNSRYYWQVNVKKTEDAVDMVKEGEIASFITILDNPQNVTPAKEYLYYEDNGVVRISWDDPMSDIKGLNIYVGTVGTETDPANAELIPAKQESYDVTVPTNITDPQTITVKAVYAGLGESTGSTTQVEVVGYATVNGTITDDINQQPVEGVTVTYSGTDRVGKTHTIVLPPTGADGKYSGTVPLGTYSITAVKEDYLEHSAEANYFENGETVEETITLVNKLAFYIGINTNTAMELGFYLTYAEWSSSGLFAAPEGEFTIYLRKENVVVEKYGPVEFIYMSNLNRLYMKLEQHIQGFNSIWANLPNGTYNVGVEIYGKDYINWSEDIERNYHIFMASTNNDWNEDSNWFGGLPGATDNVTLRAPVVVAKESDITVANVMIEGSAALTINGTLNAKDVTITKDASLVINGILKANDVINDGGIGKLLINDGGQLYRTATTLLIGKFVKNIKKPTNWETTKDGWQLMASPFTNEDVTYTYFTQFTDVATGDYDLYNYNGSALKEWINIKDKETNGDTFGTTFVNGTGYLVAHESAREVALTGTFKSGTSYTIGNLVYDDEKDLANFHLLGNPFPFNMDWSNVKGNRLVEGFAVLNENGDNYEYKTEGTIKVGEGFFIRTRDAVGTELGDPSFTHSIIRGAEKETVNSLNVIATGNVGKDNVVINFAGESEGFPKLQNFNDAIATVYVQDNGANYGIYNCDENTTEVELCFNANQMGNYTISVEDSEEFEAVILVDRFTGIETNMLLEDYTFTAMSDVNNNRFILKLAVSDQQSAVSDNFVYQSGEELIVEAEGTVQIIDMMGRVVYNNDVESTNNRINVSDFNNGAYVVRVINESEIKVEKVVIY